MAYADFDNYEKWVDGVQVVELRKCEAQAIVKINNAIMRTFIGIMLQSNMVEMLEDVCEKMIAESEALQQLAKTLDEKFEKTLFNSTGGGAFVKMHRSPKDSDYDELNDPEFFRVRSGARIVWLLCKSLRISDDLQEYMKAKHPLKLFVMPFITPIIDNEYRIFVQDEKYIGYTPCDEEGGIESAEIEELCMRAYRLYKHLAPRETYCMDVEVMLAADKVRLFEFNPFDETTELFGFKNVQE